MGRVRGLHLLHHLAALLVPGPDPRPASLRDSSTSRRARIIYGIFALGWRGSARHWHHYKIAYLLLAGLATPLVLSVHTIVSFDFARLHPARLAHHHLPARTSSPARSSPGFAMVLTLMIPARRFMGLKHVITARTSKRWQGDARAPG